MRSAGQRSHDAVTDRVTSGRRSARRRALIFRATGGVDGEDAAGDVGGLIAHQEGDRVGDLFAAAKPPEWDESPHAISRIGRGENLGGRAFGRKEAGGDGIYADGVLPHSRPTDLVKASMPAFAAAEWATPGAPVQA